MVADAIPLAGRLAEQLIDSTLDAVIENWAEERGASFATALTNAHPRAPQQQWSQVLQQHFGSAVAALNEQEGGFYVVGGATSDNALLVLTLPEEKPAEAIARAYSRCLNGSDKEREQRRLLLPVVHIALATGDVGRVPTELVEVIEEVEEQGFWSRLFGPRTRRE